MEEGQEIERANTPNIPIPNNFFNDEEAQQNIICISETHKTDKKYFWIKSA